LDETPDRFRLQQLQQGRRSNNGLDDSDHVDEHHDVIDARQRAPSSTVPNRHRTTTTTDIQRPEEIQSLLELRVGVDDDEGEDDNEQRLSMSDYVDHNRQRYDQTPEEYDDQLEDETNRTQSAAWRSLSPKVRRSHATSGTKSSVRQNDDTSAVTSRESCASEGSEVTDRLLDREGVHRLTTLSGIEADDNLPPPSKRL